MSMRVICLMAVAFCVTRLAAGQVQPSGFEPTPRPLAEHLCVIPPGASAWSDPETWGGTLPAAGATITIPAGKTVVLDMSPPPLQDLLIEGRLIIGCVDSLTLTVDYLSVRGTMRAGTRFIPFPHELEIRLGERFYDPSDPLARTFEVEPGAVLGLYGEKRSHGWLRLAATAPTGTSSLVLESPVDWRPGETIVVASTDYDFDQAEERVITSISGGGTVVGLDQPLAVTHWGVVETLGVDERAEVALLDRNIVVSGPSTSPSRGGHVRFLDADGSTRIHVSWVEFAGLGDAGLLARYPVHFHQMGDATGSYVTGASIHHSKNRGIVVHGTQNVLLRDNVCYDTAGHTYFLEDGTETGIRFVGNLGLSTRRPSPAEQLLPSDATPSTFWITNTNNVLLGNVAAGSEDYGFWYDISSSAALAEPAVFTDNVAHSNGKNGFYKYDYLSLPVPAAPTEFLRFTAYKNRNRGISYRATNIQATWREARLADNGTAVFFASDGLQQDGGNRTVLADSWVVGESGNVGTPLSAAELEFGRSLPSPGNPGNPLLGHELYEGHVEVIDTAYDSFRWATILGAVREAAAFGQLRSDNRWAIDPRIRVSGLSFQQAQPVYFAPTPALAGGNASLLIHDQDGSLMGVADHYVAAATLLLLSEGATYKPQANALHVPGGFAGNRYANLRLRDESWLATPYVSFTSVSRRVTEDVGISVNSSTYPMNILLPDDYVLAFGGAPSRSFRLELRFGLPQTSTVVAVPYANPAPAAVNVDAVPTSGQPSLSALQASSTTAWFYDTASETLAVKLVLGGTGSSIMDGTQAEVRVIAP